MIHARALTKQYGDVKAVDDLSFDIQPGVVTGLLGPNGSGKTTTMRVALGLATPTAGIITINGRSYRDLPAPMREVGAMLEAKAWQGGRTAYHHLRWLARAGGLPSTRVDEVIELVGLASSADKRVGEFSLGMSQRLGIATALLGDPQTLLLDEPVNGLDPEGILWIRSLVKRLAAEGRTVVVSSHLMSEMEETADQVIVLGRGRLIANTTMADLTQRNGATVIRVVSPERADLAPLLAHQGAVITITKDGALDVSGLDAPRIGDLAARHGIRLHELAPRRTRLETVFMDLTRDSVEHRAK